MSTLSQIEFEIASLPSSLRTEVLDFVRFVKQRHGMAPAHGGAAQVDGSEDSPFFRALDEVGFVACMETNQQLSSTYKSQLDFSNKLGTRP